MPLERRELTPESNTTSLSVLVPAFNEQHLIAASLERLELLGCSPLLNRIQVIVVDNGSTDQTPRVLRELRASLSGHWGCGKFDWEFIRLEQNRGKGGALLKALELANCELTVPHDADLEYYPEDLLKMIPLFLAGEADAVYGTRFGGGGEFRRLLFLRHALGNRLVTFLGALLCNLDLSDMATCYKMVRTELLQSIPLTHRDYRMEPELTIKLARRGAHIFEVPIRYSGRTQRQGKKLGLRDVVLVLSGLLRSALSENLYKEDRFGSQITTRLHHAPRFSRWVSDILTPYVGENVLEFGANIGSLTVHLTPRERYWATDVNPLYLHNLRRLARTQPYLRAALADISSPETFPVGPFDTVICRYALENAPDDLEALCNISRCLSDGGRAIIVVPQGPKLYGTLDEVVGHRRRYATDRLISLCRAASLEPRTIIAFNRLSSLFWWWNGKVRKRRNVGLTQIKLFNALIPLLRRVDQWLPLPSLSLIAVFEKVPARNPNQLN